MIFAKATGLHLIITPVYDMHLLLGAVYPGCSLIIGLTTNTTFTDVIIIILTHVKAESENTTKPQ